MGNFAISMVGNAIIGFLMAAFVLSVLKPRFNFALTAVITLFVVFYASLCGTPAGDCSCLRISG